MNFRLRYQPITPASGDRLALEEAVDVSRERIGGCVAIRGGLA